MLNDSQILLTFQRLGKRLLTDYTHTFLGTVLGGCPVPVGYREQLSFALRRLADPTCRLSISEQVEVATFFMPQIRQLAAAEAAKPAVLSFTAVALMSGGPVRLQAAVKVGGQLLRSLQLFRDGQPLASTGKPTLSLLDSKPLDESVTYEALATFEQAASQRKQVTIKTPQFWLYGVGPRNPQAAQIPSLEPILVSPEMRVVFRADSFQSLVIWVPLGQRLSVIRNPEFGQTNLLATFDSAALVLPGYGPGTVYWSYQQVKTPAYTLLLYPTALS